MTFWDFCHAHIVFVGLALVILCGAAVGVAEGIGSCRCPRNDKT